MFVCTLPLSNVNGITATVTESTMGFPVIDAPIYAYAAVKQDKHHCGNGN